MKIEESNHYGKLEESVLVAFERSLNELLPDAYRQYLLTYNGGRWEPSCFVISKDEGESSVHSVYGLHNGPEYCRLDTSRAIFSDRIPKDMLAIASDPFGNQICIGISGKRRDAIFFWDHEVADNTIVHRIVSSVIGKTGIIRIANSFKDFVDTLFKPEPENIQERILEDNDIDELKRLLDLHAIGLEDVNEYDRTLLEEAAIKARPEIILFLFERGAKLRSALELAEKNAEFFSKHVPVVELIKQLEKREQINN